MYLIKKMYCRIFQSCFRIALPILPYTEPKILGRVKEVIPVLKEKKYMSVLLVTDKGIRSLGLTQKLEEFLSENDIKCCVYDDTVSNPTVQNVEEAREMYISNNCQAIIAFGGGSAMDCAKGCGARIARPKKSVQKMQGIMKVGKKIPLLIAIPTTAGTGSENTLAAVITDPETHKKSAINDFPLIPKYAVLDYHVTTGLPKQITATTGMDALTHAVEAYIGRSTTAQTRKWAVDAVRLISQYLKRAYDNGQDEEAREQMLLAAYYAGASFSRSYVGYVHAIAHSLGGQYGIAHGLANAVILPIMLRLYGDSVYEKLAKLAREAGVIKNGMTDEETALAFITWIEGMNDSMNIPKNIPEIRQEDVYRMSGYAEKEGNPLYPVPVLMDRKALSDCYMKIKNNDRGAVTDYERRGPVKKTA